VGTERTLNQQEKIETDKKGLGFRQKFLVLEPI